MKFLYTILLWMAQKCQPKVIPNREAIMAYQHPELIRRLVEKYEMTPTQAKTAFEGMKQYLFTCVTTNSDNSPQDDVDEAWHNFMLFSTDYMKFCHDHFGFFIHHQPFTKAEQEARGKKTCRGIGGCNGLCIFKRHRVQTEDMLISRL